VGHFKDGTSECYAWVMPDQFPILQHFTQVILTLAAGPPQEIPSLSPVFSPTLR
jgi:hypothetical protein